MSVEQNKRLGLVQTCAMASQHTVGDKAMVEDRAGSQELPQYVSVLAAAVERWLILICILDF